jgi:hypothetical protein
MIDSIAMNYAKKVPHCAGKVVASAQPSSEEQD